MSFLPLPNTNSSPPDSLSAMEAMTEAELTSSFVMAVMAVAGFVVIVYSTTGEQIAFVVRILYNIVTAIRNKRSLPAAIPSTEEEALSGVWPEPRSSFEDYHNKDVRKIIWGFWHSGEETLPGFCQLAVKSWRVHHPDWTVIILSDANYRKYVSPSDLPSTFASLKVQYRSDLIRLAVLRRYGGLYLDASYTIYRAFDDVWKTAEEANDLYLTSLVTLQEGGVRFPNNCFILAPKPQNPVLKEWHQRTIEYLERPCLSTKEAPQHPMLQRVARHFNDPALGALSLLTAYFGVIWTLADVLYYEESLQDYVKEHVWILPSFRWTFDHIMIQNLTLTNKEILHGESYDEGLRSWMRRFPNALRITFSHEPKVADRMLQFGIAMKTSSDFYPYFHKPIEFHINRPASGGLIYRAAIDKEFWPIQQADTVGARRVVPLGGRC